MEDRRGLSAQMAAWIGGMRGLLFPWVPVMLGIGISLWFSLAWEPGPLAYGVAGGVVLAGIALRLWGGEGWHPVGVAAACIAAGFVLSGVRAVRVDAPVLSFRYYGPVEGRIVAIDRSQSDQTRVTLDRVRLDRVAPGRTPTRVRISLHGEARLRPEPGMTVMTTALLSPPDGPVEPGGFDFRRMAWFDGLGAVGYTRSPMLLLEPTEPGALRIGRLRAAIRAGVEARIEGEPGAFSAALITGDRAGIGQATLQDLRDANLAHLLAISGLHMGLLAGFVFAALRYGLAAIPPLALRVPAKKVAAVIAMAAGTFYLALSGGNVATERAWVMVMVMLGAVLFDRRALSLRSVALAATVLLALQPETLTEPGFQMSFAATTALVAAFAGLRGRLGPGRMPSWVTPVFTLFFSSLVAGFATGPFAAAHFNRIAEYGLVANMLAVPVMGLAVMPGAVVAGLLAPLGWEAPALWVMEQGTGWILWVAAMVAGWRGAVIPVVSPPAGVLGAIALGALWFVLWRGPARLAGIAPIALAFGVWGFATRPPLIVTADGILAGLWTSDGRALSAEKGAGFAAGQWLENDGDDADQIRAAARPGFSGPPTARRFRFAGWDVVVLKGKSAAGAFASACAGADLVILGAEGVGDGRCRRIDLADLRASGALAIWPEPGGGLRIEATQTARRHWSRQVAVAPWVLARPDVPSDRRSVETAPDPAGATIAFVEKTAAEARTTRGGKALASARTEPTKAEGLGARTGPKEGKAHATKSKGRVEPPQDRDADPMAPEVQSRTRRAPTSRDHASAVPDPLSQ